MVHFLEESNDELLKHFKTIEDFEKLEKRLDQLIDAAEKKKKALKPDDTQNTTTTLITQTADLSSDEDIGLDLFG